MKRKLSALLASLVLVLGLLAPLASTVSAAGKKKVMTTFYPVYYLAQRIAGDKAEVSMLLEGNQDAHDYEMSARDAAKVQTSDLFIYQDDEMEHFVEDLTKLLDTDKTKVQKTTEGIELLKGDADHEDHEDHDHDHEAESGQSEEEHHEEGEEGHHHEFDPHTWMDPMTYAKQAENVKKALVALDPENASTYEANAASLTEDLKKLDQEFKEGAAKLSDKNFVVQHAAFGYLAHAYGLEQHAITGISSTAEPSAAALAKMQEFVKEHKTKVIFVDPSLDDAIAKTVASATGAELRPLRTLETVSAEEIAAGADYFSLMRENLANLTK